MPNKLQRFKSQIPADFIFFIHLLLVFILLFGWIFPKLRYIYLGALTTTLLSELFLGYCILTKWEFAFRKKIEPALNYDYSFISYYGHKMGVRVNNQAIRYAALIFLSGSLIVFYVRT